MGIELVGDWSSSTHLTLPKTVSSLTMSAQKGLAKGLPFVTIDVWVALFKRVQTNEPLPEHTEFLPKIDGKFDFAKNCSLAPDTRRKLLFAGNTFFFLDQPQMNRYEELIRLAGGKCVRLDSNEDLTVLTEDVCVEPPEGSNAKTFELTNSRRFVAEAEISTALLLCSTHQYCNPDWKAVDSEPEPPPKNNQKKKATVISEHESPPKKSKIQKPAKKFPQH
jgi:hypothetical protein